MTLTAEHARAALSDGAGSTQVVSLPLDSNGNWLRVESSAVCGTDVSLHGGGLKAAAVLGHHVVGTVQTIDPSLARSLGVRTGDRVAMEEYLGCGQCPECITGDYRFCDDVSLWGKGCRVGMLPATQRSGLHGGNAEYVELSPRHRLHRLPADLPANLAAWTLPLANALEWVVHTGRATPEDRVVIFGPGYHGLACVAAARSQGITDVTVVGLPTDAARLNMAASIGARAVTVDDLDTVLAPDTVDLVIDTVGHDTTVSTATSLLRRYGRLVVAGLSEGSIERTALVRKLLEIRGVRGRSPHAVQRSIELLAGGGHGLSEVPSHLVPLDGIETVLNDLQAGRGPATPHVVVTPFPWTEHTTANPQTPEVSA